MGRGVQKTLLRGSMGWAASPTRANFPLCHAGMGARYNNGHRFTSFAFLYGDLVAGP